MLVAPLHREMFPFKWRFIFIASQTAPTMARIWFFFVALSFLCDSINYVNLSLMPFYCRPQKRRSRYYDILFDFSYRMKSVKFKTHSFLLSYFFFHIFRSRFASRQPMHMIFNECKREWIRDICNLFFSDISHHHKLITTNCLAMITLHFYIRNTFDAACCCWLRRVFVRCQLIVFMKRARWYIYSNNNNNQSAANQNTFYPFGQLTKVKRGLCHVIANSLNEICIEWITDHGGVYSVGHNDVMNFFRLLIFHLCVWEKGGGDSGNGPSTLSYIMNTWSIINHRWNLVPTPKLTYNWQ